MIIRKTQKQYALYRYGGTSDGKKLEVRIGTVLCGTKPGSITDDIVEDLTPRELSELKKVLAKDEQELLEQKLASLENDIAEIIEAVINGMLDGPSTTKIAATIKALLKVLPKTKPQSGTVTVGATTNFAPESTP